MPPPLEGWARSLDLSRLRDDLALSARSFLGRAGDLRPEAREDLGGRLVAAVQAVMSPPPPLGTPGWAYLSAVLAERRRRDGERLGGARRACCASAACCAPVLPAPVAAPVPEPPPPTGPFALPS